MEIEVQSQKGFENEGQNEENDEADNGENGICVIGIIVKEITKGFQPEVQSGCSNCWGGDFSRLLPQTLKGGTVLFEGVNGGNEENDRQNDEKCGRWCPGRAGMNARTLWDLAVNAKNDQCQKHQNWEKQK
jgi:hypothetical protein